MSGLKKIDHDFHQVLLGLFGDSLPKLVQRLCIEASVDSPTLITVEYILDQQIESITTSKTFELKECNEL
jgi:hypothetical protein